MTLPLLLLGVAGLGWAAKEPLLECGTWIARAPQEMFLHRQHAAVRAKTARQATATINQDVGQIAVMGDSGGVIGRRNGFDLDHKTLAFVPSAGGYTLTAAADTFDSAASDAGYKLALDDDDTRQVPMPFSFPFQGKTYSQVWVNSNGSLTFGQGDTDYTGTYGHFTSGPPALAACFADLDPSQSQSGVRVLSEAGRLVVSWSQVPLAGSAGFSFPPKQTFQIRIFPNGRIEFAYSAMSIPAAVVGITAGSFSPVTLVHFSNGPSGEFRSVGEIFSAQDAVDIVYASQKFYQTHEDAYDYLVFYNASGVSAGPGVVSYEVTTRSNGSGYGDIPTEIGAGFGSPKRLQAVLNMGPVTQYPLGPNTLVPARGSIGDTPLSVLGHEVGHLFLALVSVPDPSNPNNYPMLGRSLVHWAFTFNSEASLLEGNRIRDDGEAARPRYTTTGTVEAYSPLDQYLMGFRSPSEVPGAFAVLNSSQSNSRAPQTGVTFNGNRLPIPIDDVIRAAGPRIPDSTVAQRRYRFAFVVIVPEDADLSINGTAGGAVAQVDRYRTEFEPYFAKATNDRASADTSLKRSVILSMAPAAGVVAGSSGTATLTLATALTEPLTFTLQAPNRVLQSPPTATIPAGSKSVTFSTIGGREGVEEFVAVPSDARYETSVARVQVGRLESLTLQSVSGDQQAAPASATVTLPNPLVVRVQDGNRLPYSGVRLTASPSAGGSVQPSNAVTDESGTASFLWTPGSSSAQLRVAIANSTASSLTFNVLPRPAAAAIVNGASFAPALAAGGFATVFGTGLALGTPASASAPFPTQLGGVQVRLNGSPVPLVAAYPGQINFLIPQTTAAGAADLTVETAAGVSPVVRVSISTYAPGIFFNAATGYGAILVAGTANTTDRQPVGAGDFLEVYCTGLGALGVPVIAEIGGKSASVLYAGQSSIPGLYQVNVQVPPGLGSGPQPLTLQVNPPQGNPLRSNPVSIQLK